MALQIKVLNLLITQGQSKSLSVHSPQIKIPPKFLKPIIGKWKEKFQVEITLKEKALYMCVWVCVSVCMYVYMWVSVFMYVCVSACMCVCARPHVCVFHVFKV